MSCISTIKNISLNVIGTIMVPTCRRTVRQPNKQTRDPDFWTINTLPKSKQSVVIIPLWSLNKCLAFRGKKNNNMGVCFPGLLTCFASDDTRTRVYFSMIKSTVNNDTAFLEKAVFPCSFRTASRHIFNGLS